jgi:hypothetical protein
MSGSRPAAARPPITCLKVAKQRYQRLRASDKFIASQFVIESEPYRKRTAPKISRKATT